MIHPQPFWLKRFAAVASDRPCFDSAPAVMGDINVARMICVNGVRVPVVKEVQSVLDPDGLAGDLGDLDVLKLSLVRFKVHDSMSWLIKALDLPGCKWWSDNHDKSGLLAEVLTLIRGAKWRKGRMPKMPTALVPLKIRGRVLWFQNNPRCVVLALVDPDNYDEAPAEDSAVTDLAWFLQEFMKDFQHDEPGDSGDPGNQQPDESLQLVEVPEEPDQAAEPELEAQGRIGGLPRSNTPSWAQTQVEQALKDLGAHTDCKSAVWCAARRSFQVVRHSDHAKKEFVVKGLKRKWEQAQDRNIDAKIQEAFDRVMSSATSFLREEIAAPDAAPLAAPVADAQGEDL